MNRTSASLKLYKNNHRHQHTSICLVKKWSSKKKKGFVNYTFTSKAFYWPRKSLILDHNSIIRQWTIVRPGRTRIDSMVLPTELDFGACFSDHHRPPRLINSVLKQSHAAWTNSPVLPVDPGISRARTVLYRQFSKADHRIWIQPLASF